MTKINKEKVLNGGICIVGMVLVMTSCLRQGSDTVLKLIKDKNLKITTQDGELVNISLPSRIPFKK